jgi:hypothetical protein
MLTTQNITSRTLQGSCHMKYTNLCNEENQTKPSTPKYLITRPNHNQTNISKESNLVNFLFQ